MPVMYSFCFWFSVRLGAIIVAVVSMLQTLPCLVVVCVGLEDEHAVSENIEEWLDSYELLSLTDILKSVKKDPHNYLVTSLILLMAYTASCVLLILGALKCNLWLVYPYIALDLARLILLSVNFVLIMMIVKENILNLGLIIGGSLAGGFALLYLYYLWFCTVSLCQIVKAVNSAGGESADNALTQLRPRKLPPGSVGLNDFISDNRQLFGLTRPAY